MFEVSGDAASDSILQRDLHGVRLEHCVDGEIPSPEQPFHASYTDFLWDQEWRHREHRQLTLVPRGAEFLEEPRFESENYRD